MKRSGRFIAGFALASFMFAAPLSAQDPIEGEGSMQVGNATVTVGAGAAILTLPDVPSLITLNVGAGGGRPNPFISGFKFSDDFGDEIGWNVNGSIEVPMGANKTISLSGFWANIDDEDSARCDDPGGTLSCFWFELVDDPAVRNGFSATGNRESVISKAEREVDQWGVSLEVKQQLNSGAMGVTQAPPRHFLAVGADVRGIDQDLDANLIVIVEEPRVAGATYTEDLDTHYYGAYAAWGGDFPRLLIGGLWERWGLHSTFQLRGGIYYADTDYDGRIVDQQPADDFNISSALSLSDDKVAFIGGLVMETSKRIGRRATLSLRSEYEYYSYVPRMAYNQLDIALDVAPIPDGVAGAGGQVGTVINDDDAFSMRTSLRLTIKLGPDSVMEPLK